MNSNSHPSKTPLPVCRFLAMLEGKRINPMQGFYFANWHSTMSFPIFDVVRAYPLWATFSSLLCAVILKATFITHRRNPGGLPLAPGPKGLPIIGNLLDMPLDKPWLIYNEWSKTYGKISLRLIFPTNNLIFVSRRHGVFRGSWAIFSRFRHSRENKGSVG